MPVRPQNTSRCPRSRSTGSPRDAGTSRGAGESPHPRATCTRALDPGDFRQTVEKIGLYKYGAESPLTPDEIVRIIVNAGRTPVERDTLYNVIAEGYALVPSKPFRRQLRRSLEVVP